MASGIFAILDDIAILMDDVAVMSKVATRKTAGILGDDLAVNAEKATGFVASRELPVLWAITKGSFINKIIILPVVFLLNSISPQVIVFILIMGGLYLAYEGAEKVIHFFSHLLWKGKKDVLQEDNFLGDEKSKIKSAVKTDFILSLEIIIIALSTVLDKSLMIQITVVSIVSIIATIGVYGLVALLVRMDDLGLLLKSRFREESFLSRCGDLLISLLPKIIKSLSIIGTIALLLVSGGIFIHNIHFLHELFPFFPIIFKELIIGLLVGCLVMVFVYVTKKIDVQRRFRL